MKAEDRRKLIKRVQTLDGITDDERAALLGLLRESKTYGLVWEDKPEDVEERLREELPVLTEVRERAIISDNPDAPNHIIIEGDNLESLSTLAYTHAGKIDVIYIDPPYNTGNKDFIYNDAYVDKEDVYRHSKWLSFMSKRLRIAKKLLADRGVIFMSIDENEEANLKLLCDEIFGRKNMFANHIWKSKSGGANDSKFVATDSEYILAYAKDIDSLNLLDDDGATVTTSYNHEDENGRYALDRLDKQSLGYHESLDFPITGPDGRVYTVFHSNPEHKVARWRWSAETVRDRYDELVFENGFVYTKNYESEGSMPRNILIEERFGRTRSGKTELFSIVGPNKFNNPKPSKLISYFISLFPDKNCLVLDFFAGSGTTLNAVMRNNFIDDGHRTCILVTNNEGGICENVTYPRIRNVIRGYKSKGKNSTLLLSEKINLTKFKNPTKILDKINSIKEKKKNEFNSFKVEIKDGAILLQGVLNNSENIEGLHDNNLRYYRTEFVGRSRSVQNMRRLVNLSTDMLCIKEDLYTEKKQFAGQKTYKGVFRFFDNGKKQMLVIYREEVIADLVPLIASTDCAEPIKVYVFSPSEDPWEAEFEDVADKVQLCALPQAIYNTYKRILPKPKDRNIAAEEQTAEPKQDSVGGLFDFAEEGGEA